MKKTLLIAVAAASLFVGTLATTGSADARCRWGCAAAIGAGAVVGGAIIGGALAGPPPPAYAYPQYAPVDGYAYYDGYRARAPIGCPGGYWARRPLVDRWGNQVGWSRPRFFCPY